MPCAAAQVGSAFKCISRHNHLQDNHRATAVASGLGPVREVRFLIPLEDSRPADVLLPHWVGGKDAALDVTVINPCQTATAVHCGGRSHH